MRVLYLGHHSPWPTWSGGRLRDAQLLPRMLAHADIDLVAVTRQIDADKAAGQRVQLPGLRSFLFADQSRSCFAPSRDSDLARRFLYRRSEQYDLVHVEGHYLLHMLPESCLEKTVLVEHNVESALLEQRTSIGHAVSASELSRVRDAEALAWRQVARVVLLTDEDAAAVAMREPTAKVMVAANGWDHLPPRSPDETDGPGQWDAPRIVFLANHAYAPSRDATHWLVNDIFPQVRTFLPQASLVLAGANLDPDLVHRAGPTDGVEVAGWVPAVTDELDRANVVVCPLRVGGGVKVKTTEALRRGCLLVSTSVGAQGLSALHRAAVSVADTAGDFAMHVVRLCSNRADRERQRTLIRRAQPLMPTWDEAAKILAELWNETTRPPEEGRRTSDVQAI